MIIGDGANTAWDMVFNLAGVGAAVVWLATAGVARRTSPAEPTGAALSPWRRPRWRPRPG